MAAPLSSWLSSGWTSCDKPSVFPSLVALHVTEGPDEVKDNLPKKDLSTVTILGMNCTQIEYRPTRQHRKSGLSIEGYEKDDASLKRVNPENQG